MVSVRLLPRFAAPALSLAVLLGADGAAFAQTPTPPQPKAQTETQAPAPEAPAEQPAAETAPPAEPASPPAPVLTPAELQELEELKAPIEPLKTEVERLGKAVERNLENDEELARLRGEVINVFRNARAAREALTPKHEAVRQQIEGLGPPPAKEAAPEADQVAAERARLNAIAAELDGALKNLELIVVRNRQLRETVQVARQQLFASQILKRSPSPLKPSTWQKVVEDVPGTWRQVADSLSGWLSLAGRKWIELSALVVGVVALFAVLTALVRWFLAVRLGRRRESPPSFFVKAATVGWVAVLKAAPALAALVTLGAGLDGLRLLTHEVGQIAETAFPALYLFVAVSALTRAILQPRRPDWRLVDLATPAARRLTRIVTGIAAVFSGDLILQEAVARLYLPLSISVTEMALASIAIGVLMIALVRTPFQPMPAEAAAEPAAALGGAAAPAPPSWLSPYLIKLPILVVAAAILALSLTGYIGLGRFITKQVVVTGSAIAVILVFHLAIRALLGAPGTGIKPLAKVLEEKGWLDAGQSGLVVRALSLVLNAGLAVAAIPVIMLTWGYSLAEVLYWLRSLVFGFQIGDFRISLARILIAGLLFLALVLITRLVQRWLDSGVLRSKRIDQGIANSIHTAIGYAGFIIAALVAVSYGGLDITNFAIVAGALSVGIGFGLQSIVNNFVSGLILLVERPIKVGDRVAVGDREGFVRRISVRSTEIETGDKASLIVPNSELITSTVTNWTHRNALGTAVVRVVVGYQSDPEQVRAILQQVGADCPLVLQHPAPGVSFDNFGANGLEFSLTAVVPDVTKAGAVQSDLRFAILKAFREAGIEMPYAQHDIHLRDLDAVRGVLTRLAEARAREAEAVDGNPAGKR